MKDTLTHITHVHVTLSMLLMCTMLCAAPSFAQNDAEAGDSGEALIIIEEDGDGSGEAESDGEDQESSNGEGESSDQDKDRKEGGEKEDEKAPQRITITAQMEAPDSRSIPGQMSFITAEEIEASAPKDVTDIIEPMLGANLTRYGGAGSSSFVSIRGSSAEQVLVLVNGKKINSAQGGGVDLSTINPDSIERIEVHRGGNSAVYGENAVGGVINIITKDAGGDGLSGSARAGYGSFETVYGSATVSAANEEESRGFSVSAHGLTSRGDYRFEDEHFGTLERKNADSLKGGASANIYFHPLQPVEVAADGSIYLDERGVPGTVEFPSEKARMTDERETVGVETTWESRAGDFIIDGGFTRQVREYEEPDFYLGPIDDRHENRALEAETRYEDEYAGSSFAASWLGGYGYRQDLLDSTAFTGQGGTKYSGEDIERRRHSLFGRGELRLFPYAETGAARLAIFPATRLDSWRIDAFDGADSSSGRKPSWKIGLLSALTAEERVVLKSSAGSSYRVPSFDDLFWPSTAFATGNPDLEPEESYFVDGGLVIAPIPAFRMEASVFYREVTNLIQWSPEPSGQWRPVNIGKSSFFGVESELRALIDIPLISSYLETTVNGNYLYAVDRTKDSATFGKVIPRKPLWQANGIVSLTHDRGHSLRAELRNVGYRYITAANTKWFDPYTILDLAATIVLGRGFELILAADNVFNVSYVDMREYPVPGSELSAEVKYEF